MTNLDYEQRMSALNQLIHETLGVSLNTVRAAYGRARNTTVNVQSSASRRGRLPVSSSRLISLADLTDDDFGAVDTGRVPASPRVLEHAYALAQPARERSLTGISRSFRSRFRKAREHSDGGTMRELVREPRGGYLGQRKDTFPMLILSRSGIECDAGETASDWHKLRNEFWSLAQTDSFVMERYTRDVLG